MLAESSVDAPRLGHGAFQLQKARWSLPNVPSANDAPVACPRDLVLKPSPAQEPRAASSQINRLNRKGGADGAVAVSMRRGLGD